MERPDAQPGDSTLVENYGKENTVVSLDEKADIEAQLRAMAGTITSGIDPNTMVLLTRLAMFHVEAGARSFPEFSRAMSTNLNDIAKGLGEKLSKYFRSLYESVRHMPENQHGSQMSTGEQIEAFDTEQKQKAAKPKRRVKPRTQGTDNQVPYEGASGSVKGVNTPTFMADPIQEALFNLQQEEGDITEFVAKELGYKNADEVREVMYPYQIDAVAQAIVRAKDNKVMINADETGMGKGRVAAGMIRWAKRQGHIRCSSPRRRTSIPIWSGI